MPSVGDKTEMILGKLAVIDGKLDDLLKKPPQGASGEAGGKKGGKGFFKYEGAMPTHYCGLAGAFNRITKGEDGFNVVMPVELVNEGNHLLEGDTLAGVDDILLLPVELRDGNATFVAVHEDAKMSTTFVGKYGNNEGRECTFIKEYKQVVGKNDEMVRFPFTPLKSETGSGSEELEVPF